MRDYTSVILDEANYGGLPVCYWPLDEVNGTVARDVIVEARGTGYPLTIAGSYSTEPSPINGSAATAMRFDGATNYAYRNSGVLSPTSPFTIAAWVKGVPQSNRWFLCFANASTNAPLFGLRTGDTAGSQDTAGLTLFIRSNANVISIGNVAGHTFGTVMDGTWHHAAAALGSSGVARLYTDGEQVGSVSGVFPTTTTCDRTAVGAVLRATPSLFFDGLIGGMVLMQREMDAAGMRRLFLGGRNGPPPRGIFL